MSKIKLNDNCIVSSGQRWKHKYSNEKILVQSHIINDIWDYQDLSSQKINQVTSSELVADWKIIK